MERNDVTVAASKTDERSPESMFGKLGKFIRNVAATVPDILSPFSTLAGGSVTKDGNGMLFKATAPVLAGAQATFTHGLNRLPNRAQVLFNPGAYCGDCFIAASTVTTVTVQYEMAQGVGAITRVV